MRYLLGIFLFLLIVHVSYSQGCGIYRITYTGYLSMDSSTSVKVVLPTTLYLHGLSDIDSERLFVGVEPKGNKIELELKSQIMTSYLDAQMLKQMYKSELETLPIRLLISKNGIVEQKTITLDWDQVEIKKTDERQPIGEFEINLKEIKAE
jgi:hypothetical protein